MCICVCLSLYMHAVYGLTETILAAGQLSVLLIRHYIDFDYIPILEGYSGRIIHRYTSGFTKRQTGFIDYNKLSKCNRGKIECLWLGFSCSQDYFYVLTLFHKSECILETTLSIDVLHCTLCCGFEPI